MLNLHAHPLLMVLRPVLLPMLIAVAMQIIASLSGWLVYQSLVDMAQGLMGKTAVESVSRSLWIFVIGLGLQSGLGAIALAITHFADASLQRALRMQLIDKLGRLPAIWFSERPSGSTRQIIQNDVEALHQLVAHSLVEGVALVMTPLVGLCFCFTLNWRLGLTACAPVALYFLILTLLARGSMRDIMRQISLQLAEISAIIVDYVRGIAVLKVFGRAGEGYQRFTDASRRFHDDFSSLVRPAMKAQSVAIIAISSPVVALLMLLTGMWGVESGTMTAAEIMVATLVAMLLPASIMTVALASQVRSAAFVAAADIQRLLSQEELPDATERVSPGAGEVTLRGVGFSYGETEILRGINLTLPAGSFTALVGPSGAGKTTLARLLARQQDVSCGQICIDGHDIRQIPLSQLYEIVGVLEQTPALPAISLAQNIALGMEDVPLEAIRQAARAALIDERIMALPRGYDAVPGIDAHLSGGEAQRVAIARLFLAARPILIMDEATSAIDPDAEIELREAIANLARGRTTLAIAHRLSTIQGADQIVLLDKGQIRERGKHQTLLADDKQYACLWREFIAERQTEGTI
ncbi:ABC transporter ATP-binding protein [Buttiauxella warmboldiae]|uniref:ABC transporter ATP-binding protein n=2 Tax=Buttiauxella warmboldiae TaxID=82993 RepID=A0A3N5DAA0_9ENTR|nr:ABC transporter ATP-binding protein [Buttiauxella warmboldiae]